MKMKSNSPCIRLGRYQYVYFFQYHWPERKNITVYSDIEKMDNDQTIYTDAVFKDGNKQEERLEDGIVNITRFDLNNRIISGTFEGGRVTEGRFDLTF